MSNRLARESSPYLQQHADNPVDWYPWGSEALTLAQEEDRPILLSIGYSACHWCHVMERESFADPEVARIMNEGFVNVKVDREERPDVDAIYMRAVQSLTGRGGWPLTVFLTPDGRPFYGGTYFPPQPRHGMPSFRQLLAATRNAWEERRNEVEKAAGQITRVLEESARVQGPAQGPGQSRSGGRSQESDPVDPGVPSQAAETLLSQLDTRHGGFGNAPKFPQPAVLDFLLAHHAATGGSEALKAAMVTLEAMARGGIRDHLGGGFHRYSVDARWLVPHFEKMLYDNALLASTYLRAFQVTGEPAMETVVRETLDYLLEDMRSPDGAFYAARDADSEGEEGTFYLWDVAEVEDVLDPEDARLFLRAYGLSHEGNFEGRNILHLPQELDTVAMEEGMAREALDASLARSRGRLLEIRAQRIPPRRDSKILAGWNGLALRALAEAGAVLEDGERYLTAAREGMAYLLEALRPQGRLLHQLPGQEGREILAFLDDVTAVGLACLALHEATLEGRWLEEAVTLAQEVEDWFRDDDTGLLFDTPSDGEALVVRPREVMDNAVPSGNSMAAELFLWTGRILGREEQVQAAQELAMPHTEALTRMPTGFGRLLKVAQALTLPPLEVALFGDGEALDGLLTAAHQPFLPQRVISGVANGEEAPFATPLLESRGTVDGEAAAWVCSGFTCQAPVTTPQALAQTLTQTLAQEARPQAPDQGSGPGPDEAPGPR